MTSGYRQHARARALPRLPRQFLCSLQFAYYTLSATGQKIVADAGSVPIH